MMCIIRIDYARTGWTVSPLQQQLITIPPKKEKKQNIISYQNYIISYQNYLLIYHCYYKQQQLLPLSSHPSSAAIIALSLPPLGATRCSPSKNAKPLPHLVNKKNLGRETKKKTEICTARLTSHHCHKSTDPWGGVCVWLTKYKTSHCYY
jgi:hypothetical protein